VLPFIGKSLLKGSQLRQCQIVEKKNYYLEIYGLDKFCLTSLLSIKTFFSFFFLRKKRNESKYKRIDEGQAYKCM
jgi:hypothetical protein